MKIVTNTFLVFGFFVFMIFAGCGLTPIEDNTNGGDNVGTFTVFRTENGLADNSVTDMAVDYMSNRVWFATRNGISFYSNADSIFYTYGAEYEIPALEVISITVDFTGNVWAGTVSGPTTLYKNSYLWTAYPNMDKLVHHYITDIVIMNDLSRWFGTRGGITVESSLGFTSYTVELVPSSEVTSITQSGSGQIWVGTTNGISVYNKITKNWTYYGAGTLPSTSVNVVYDDGRGKIWCGTSSIAVSYDGSSWVSYGPADGLTASGINDFVMDSSGILWAATDGGVFYLTAEKWNIFSLPVEVEDAPVNAIIYDVLTGAYWIGTNNGLVRYITSKE